jgi:hypothetical protein
LLAGNRVAYVVAGLGGVDYPVQVVDVLIELGFSVRTPWWNSTTPVDDVPRPDPNRPGKFTPFVDHGDSDPGSLLLEATSPAPPTFVRMQMNLGVPNTPHSMISEVVADLESNFDGDDLVVLIGHGLGAHSVLEVSRRLDLDSASGLTTTNVDLLALLDPMGFISPTSTQGLLDQMLSGAFIAGRMDPSLSPSVTPTYRNGLFVGSPLNDQGLIPAFRSPLSQVPANVRFLYNRWQTNAVLPFDFDVDGTLPSLATGSVQADFAIADQKVSNSTASHLPGTLDRLYGLGSGAQTTAHLDPSFPQDATIQSEIETILRGLTRPQNFVVTTTDDLVSGQPARGSLRAAILLANTTPGFNTITFDIVPRRDVYTIGLDASLPAITETVSIDATTQPEFAGRPIVVVNGANTPGDGLVVTSDDTLVRGLIVNGFTGAGIRLERGDRNTIELSWLGVGATGASAGQPNAVGLLITSGSSRNTIGGLTAGTANLISGNSQAGILIQGQGSSGNVIIGNRVGTHINGSQPLANEIGIVIENGSDNVIGGPQPGAGNLISGNREVGVLIEGAGAVGTRIQGNFIGSNAEGQAPVVREDADTLLNALQQAGVALVNAGSTLVGGPGPGEGNLLSGNYVGVVIAGSGAHVVQGNRIGTGVEGRSQLANVVGVYINSASGQRIGGSSTGEGNVISGNRRVGVEILGAGSSGNIIDGNLIGVAADGVSTLVSSDGPAVQPAGIFVLDASDNLIGSISGGPGNLIAGNEVGVYFLSRSGVARGNAVAGNTIGGTTGAVPGNSIYGVLFYNASRNRVIRRGEAANVFGRNGINNVRDFTGPVPPEENAAVATTARGHRKQRLAQKRKAAALERPAQSKLDRARPRLHRRAALAAAARET